MNGKLAGARIWLSGSFPEEASPDEKSRIRQFVQAFAKVIFREGGTILHGSHPDIREPLLAAAEHFKSNSTSSAANAPLGLYVSQHFSKSPEKYGIDLVRWRNLCGDGVVETVEAARTAGQSESDALSNSLEIMRQIMVAKCNSIVAFGGKWWEVNRKAAGVPREIELAKDSRLPLFLVGGVGQGAVAGLLREFPELMRECANGLAQDENERLAAEKDPTRAAEIIIHQLPGLRLREITPEKRPFRILCLDGGGIRGAYSAAVLNYLETTFNLRRPDGPRLANYFDLIAGTSTGGILAVGLGLGMTAKEMQSFYVDHGRDIFGSGEGLDAWWHSMRHWFTSKFDQRKLQEQLLAAYAASPVAQRMGPARESWMDNSICHLLVATYNTDTDTPHFFRTPHERFKYTDRGNDPVFVALASAAAPTYFAPVTAKNAVTSFAGIDGGVWANTPVSVALAEAIAELGASLEQIRVLSIGTTHTAKLTGRPMQLDGNAIASVLRTVLWKPFGFIFGFLVARCWPKNVRLHGIAGWVANIASLLMKTQSQTSDLISRQLLGERYLRIDSVTEYDALDDVSNTNHFINLGEAAAKDAATLAKIQALFIDAGPIPARNAQ
ncbi:patatin-like phospholipase [Bradyrhizobium macuxiense]|uniref:Patatin-like phospholipase n=1 Tax=Bradyrhizobium macuxiense TaxID=1755647 RepID=A0A560KU18_9BRAD|nr:patatin-like phospholipase family protein [Bradyrhizobium macuxiense]TWB86763.1 patatin-like phospholipase [Bradyrhizobium macuxiense]